MVTASLRRNDIASDGVAVSRIDLTEVYWEYQGEKLGTRPAKSVAARSQPTATDDAGYVTILTPHCLSRMLNRNGPT
jgi:hypothetical protein